jgi:hypothetical protein
MSDEKNVVVTVCGRNDTIEKFSISILAEAASYCETINSLQLEGESWVNAKVISPGTHYTLENFLPVRFDVILKLDDRAIQKIMREVDSQELALALKSENADVQDKIFKNMSRRAAGILKEDMEYMGPVRLKDVEKAQEKIIGIMHQLENTGEIIIAPTGDIIQ